MFVVLLSSDRGAPIYDEINIYSNVRGTFGLESSESMLIRWRKRQVTKQIVKNKKVTKQGGDEEGRGHDQRHCRRT